MKKKVFILLPVFCLLLLGIGLAGLLKNSSPDTEKPVVLTTIAPYAGFLEELGQGHFEVVTLIPSNFDPHLFEPTPRDLLKVGNTTLWVRCGEPIEEKFETVLPKKAERMLLPSFENRHHYCSHHHEHMHNTHDIDPHYWTSPKMLEADVKEMANALTISFPEIKGEILARSDAIQKRLNHLDSTIRSALVTKGTKAILVSHPSFGPFCDEYGIEQISLESEGKELSGKDLFDRQTSISGHDALFVVTQPQHPFPDLGHFSLAERPRFEVDPYSQNIEATLLHLAEHLRDDPPRE